MPGETDDRFSGEDIPSLSLARWIKVVNVTIEELRRMSIQRFGLDQPETAMIGPLPNED